MENANLTVRLNPKMKSDFTELCNNMGMNVSTAISIFITTFLRCQGIPFAVTARSLNEMQTLKAIDNVNKGKNLSKVFHSTEELMEDLNA